MQYEALIERIQREQSEWALKNFGVQPAGRMVFGMIEELDELETGLEGLNLSMVEDAIGDVGIYMLNYCNIKQWELSKLWHVCSDVAAASGYKMACISKLMGRMAHHQLKGEQNIRGGIEFHDKAMYELLCVLLGRLQELSIFAVRLPFPEILKRTWVRVSKRDWVENPNNADVIAEAQNV